MCQGQRQHSPFPAGSQPGELCPRATIQQGGRDGAASNQDEQFLLQADQWWSAPGHNRWHHASLLELLVEV